MDFFSAQDFFKQMYPNKNIAYEFDISCIRHIDIIHNDGRPNAIHHIEYQKMKVSVEGMDPIYISIQPHRECITWEYLKNHVNNLPNPIQDV